MAATLLATGLFTWGMLLLLGAFHGINPGMGWLFAVGLGLQEQRRAAVWAALLPLALGHALAVAATVLIAGLLGHIMSVDQLKWVVAAVLILYGAYRLLRARHPRYGGMQVGPRELTIWSFLMASAHGAGLMVLPFFFGTTAAQTGHDHSLMHNMGSSGPDAAGTPSVLMGLSQDWITGLLVTLVHTGGYILVMGLVAVLVYEKLGLRFLRSAWLNLDLLWAGALILTGILTLLL